MKRILLAAAAGLAVVSGGAQAQNVTLYGLLDASVEHLDNIGAAGEGLTRMNTLAGSFASRWGMRGSEDLGGGLKAVFTLESGFGIDSGVSQQGNRLFGRQAFVGVSGDWGQVALGRQYASLFYVSIKTDPFLASAYGPGAFDTYLAGPRLDNSISYLGKWGGLTAHAIYSLGRDNNGSATPTCAGESATINEACHSWSVGALYEGAGTTWGVGGWYDAQEIATGVGSDDRFSVNGYVSLGQAKIMANFLRRDNDTTGTSVKSNLWSIAASYPFTPQITGEISYYDFDLKGSDADSQMVAARLNYNFSKRTTAYVYVAHMMNDGTANRSVSIGTLPPPSPVNPAAGENQTGFMVGLVHRF